MVERGLAGDGFGIERRWVPLASMSEPLPRAVVAAEDGRFWEHGGFDWEALERAREEARRSGEPMRGASTITHQLIKNLFFTTHRNPARKAFEWALTPVAEVLLPKERILELYLNVVELGPGVFGAEAGARHHFGVGARELGRRQAAGLAAILPAPRSRTPENAAWYRDLILRRMGAAGH
jgi:monofunctional biosynthetic peptidoglycan transglycosylase